MAKKLQRKFPGELGGLSFGKKDTAKISVSSKFDTARMTANEAQELLASGQLRVRIDRAAGPTLPMEGAPPTTVELDATCHRISFDLGAFYFGLSFPKTAADANTLATFAGADVKLIITRTGDLGTVDEDSAEDEDKDGE